MKQLTTQQIENILQKSPNIDLMAFYQWRRTLVANQKLLLRKQINKARNSYKN